MLYSEYVILYMYLWWKIFPLALSGVGEIQIILSTRLSTSTSGKDWVYFLVPEVFPKGEVLIGLGQFFHDTASKATLNFGIVSHSVAM